MQRILGLFTPSRFSKIKSAILIGYYILLEYRNHHKSSRSDVTAFDTYARKHKPPPLSEISKTITNIKRLQGERVTNVDKMIARKMYKAWKNIYEGFNLVRNK